jgi:hypothetical protein
MGTPPWTIAYTNGSVIRTKHNIQSSPYVISTEDSGVYRITEVHDSTKCSGVAGSTSVEVIKHQLPNAHLGGGGIICAGKSSISPNFFFEIGNER